MGNHILKFERVIVSVKAIRKGKKKRAGSIVELSLPHCSSEKSINEYIENLKKKDTPFVDLTTRIKRIITYVQKNIPFTYHNLIYLQKINNCLNLIDEKYNENLNNQYVLNALLNDLISSLLFADLMYHPGDPPPDLNEKADEKEMREYSNDNKRWIPTSTIMNIRQKSCATSQNKNLKDVLMIIIKTIEDDIGFSEKESPHIDKDSASAFIEKIMGPD